MENEQVNPPTELEVKEHRVAAPEYHVVLTVTLAVPAKPVPVTVIEVPTVPLVGERVMLEITVKLAVALFEDASVAVTTCDPAVSAGIVAVQLNVPVPLVVVLPQMLLAAEPAMVTVMAEVAAKPVPVTVVVEPTMPDETDKVITGTVTSAVEDADVSGVGASGGLVNGRVPVSETM